MKFQHWLLVAVVVVALAVIFKPLMYRVAEHRHPLFQETKIPQRANTSIVIDTSEIDKNFAKVHSSLSYTHAQSTPSNASNTSLQGPTGPALMNKPIQKPVLLQIGSFQQAGNALQLVNSLKAKGYQAYQEQENSVYHVYVGPLLGIEKTNKVKASLEQQTQMKAIVVEYSPLKDLK